MINLHPRGHNPILWSTGQLRSVQAKRDRLTSSDLARGRSQEQLSCTVAERYSLPLDQAARDVST
jgi:hypothetical protein